VKNGGDGGGSEDDDSFEIGGMNGYVVIGGSLGLLAVLGIGAFQVLRSREEELCPDCDGDLEYVEDYESWYCFDCDEYK